ncbi:MAG TPA: glycosyltransferase family 2 protein [Spirochaetota bacterium]|nr:glycosyltransferase family 2 protein [Spirochaetota bacterium]HOS31671.1 glycosyltransferase family 2 protein [Spirochaetota bacterium]HOS56064.1 glycosyltransferase family 2 protein [Spirochaetota bacterium]HPK61857.1 glycosyltransferase family 2 protein [Spirochaetota bacterium]HQF77219.1 glycosyltransferase family 2 protein [Spirochaetota bacterium]
MIENKTKNLKALISICVYNEEKKIGTVLEKIKALTLPIEYDVIIIDDGSTDETESICKNSGYFVIRHEKNQGVGSSIRDAIKFGIKNNFDILIAISGNGKTQSEDIEKMLNPIITENFDFVKGSRYLKGGTSPNLPLFRNIMIRLYSFIVSIFMVKKITDVTCLIGAYKLNIFNNENINIDQQWLDKYEMEYYILYKVLKYKYKFIEVPVNIVYPPTKKNYSKIKPFSGWWSMIRPWIFLILGIKK